MPKVNNPISRQVFRYVILGSTFFILLTSCLFLLLDFNSAKKEIQDSVAFIKQAHLQSITINLYKMDDDELRVNLAGILKLPGIKRIQVIDEMGSGYSVALGEPNDSFTSTEVIPLLQPVGEKKQKVGSFYVSTSMKSVFMSLFTRTVAIVCISTVLVLLMSLMMIKVFNRLVTRHLISMASFAGELNLESISGRIVLDRPSEIFDELDMVAKSFNAMLSRIEHEIAEHKKSGDEIIFQNILLTNQQEASIDGILIVNEQGMVLSHNHRFEEIWGIPSELLATKNDEQLLQSVINKIVNPEEFLQKVRYLYDNKGETSRDEITLVNGHVVDRYSSPLSGEDGKCYGRIWYFRDITESKQAEADRLKLEQQLLRAQKLEAIGTLAGGIAHDFNNILSPIVGYTELARMQAKDDPELSEYLNQVGQAASRATDLVRQILTLSRKAEQQKIPLQVSSVVMEALKLLRSSIPTSIEIRQEIATQASVFVDPTRIHQVVMNLCTNAYHAMEKTGGVLAVSLKETEIPPEKILGGEIPPGRYVVLEVSDTGCGMDRDTQAKIFDPYFTTKDQGKGTGLGLAVVHGIVKDHQGIINVYSEPGRGATFRVYLPLIEAQMPVVDVKREEATPTEKHERILFVDDEDRICTLAKEFLTKYGYRVDVCSNGRDALFAIEQDLTAYDLLVTDMTMPGINGKELAKKVLALRPNLPVILCTGYSSLIDREEATRIGIRGYIEKPGKRSQGTPSVLSAACLHTPV